MNILITLCILLISVLVHETGHFSVAKLFNYSIEEFSIGMGPKILRTTRNEIAYTIRILPLGGYVRFSEEKGNKGRCISEPSFSKFIVLIMGVVFNLLLSILCLTIVEGIGGANFFEAIYRGISHIGYVLSKFLSSLNLLGDIDSYGSIVAFANTANEFINAANGIKEAIINILVITATLNLNLAIINLLPLPILDGGQIIINIVELIIRRKISTNVKGTINALCWLLIMGLSVFLIVRDIINL